MRLQVFFSIHGTMCHTPQRPKQSLMYPIMIKYCDPDLPGFPGFFLKYNRGKLQYGSFSYPPSKKISLQMRVLPVICHNIDFAWGVVPYLGDLRLEIFCRHYP